MIGPLLPSSETFLCLLILVNTNLKILIGFLVARRIVHYDVLIVVKTGK